MNTKMSLIIRLQRCLFIYFLSLLRPFAGNNNHCIQCTLCRIWPVEEGLRGAESQAFHHLDRKVLQHLYMYFFKPSTRILTFTKHTAALTSVQKGLYVFVLPQGRIVQIVSQRVHGILKDRKDKHKIQSSSGNKQTYKQRETKC